MTDRRWRPLHMIAGIIMVLGIAFAAIFLYFGRITEQNISRERNSALQLRAVKQKEYAEEMLDSQFRILESLAEFLGDADDWQEQKRVFGIAAKIAIETEEFWRLTMAKENGDSITSDEYEGSIVHRNYFHKALSGERTVSEPFVSNVEEGYICMMLAVPIHNKAGEITGILGGSYKLEKFAELLLDSYNEENTYEYALLTDKSGEILVASYYGQVSAKAGNIFDREGAVYKDGSSREIIREMMGEQQIYTSHVMDGTKELYMTQTPFGYNRWTIFSIMDAEQVNRPYRFITDNAKSLNRLLGSALAVCFALIFMILIWDRRILNAERRVIQEENMQLVLSEETLRFKAQTDTMTGLTNKAATQELIIQKLSMARQTADGMLIADLDGLKRINDTLGHFEGDRAILAVADTLRKHFRETDIVGRIGGDEFMIYLNGVKSETQLRSITSALGEKISSLRIGKCNDFPIGVSIGIVLVEPSDRDFFELYKKADTALYYVKRHEKNGYAVYASHMEDEESTG